MSNITLSIDDDIIKHAKIKAVQDGVSLSAKVRELLQRYVSGQLDQAAPDLSFVQNALLFSSKNSTVQTDSTRVPSPLVREQIPLATSANGISVDANYLRKIRSWAREDLYDRPTNYGKSTKQATRK